MTAYWTLAADLTAIFFWAAALTNICRYFQKRMNNKRIYRFDKKNAPERSISRCLYPASTLPPARPKAYEKAMPLFMAGIPVAEISKRFQIPAGELTLLQKIGRNHI